MLGGVPFKSFIGHRVREGGVHLARIVQPRNRPRLIVFDGESSTGGCGDLRARSVGRVLRRMGWRVTIVPPQLEWVQRARLIRLERPSLILLQQTRHPLNHPRLYPGIPCVLDIDDADILDPSCAERVVECCRESRAILAGNHWLADRFRGLNDDVSVVWTGSYVLRRATAPARRRPIVSWAHSSPFSYPVEAKLMADVLRELAARTSFEFWLYGVQDPARAAEYLAPLTQAGVRTRCFATMGYRRFVQSLAEVAVGLHPVCPESAFSQGKSFGKLLAYLAAGVAVVTTRAVDHGLFFRNGENGFLVDDNRLEGWVSAIRLLLEDKERRQRVVAAATFEYEERLSTRTAAERVDDVLRRVLAREKSGRGAR